MKYCYTAWVLSLGKKIGIGDFFEKGGTYYEDYQTV